MSAHQAPRDVNFIPATLFEIDGAPGTVMPGQIDQTTGRVLVQTSGGSSTSFQKDVSTSTNGQTVFVPSRTVSFDVYMTVNGLIQTPSTDYSIVAGNYVLTTGIPQDCSVILCYTY